MLRLTLNVRVNGGQRIFGLVLNAGARLVIGPMTALILLNWLAEVVVSAERGRCVIRGIRSFICRYVGSVTARPMVFRGIPKIKKWIGAEFLVANSPLHVTVLI